jgi:hypothetical protein
MSKKTSRSRNPSSEYDSVFFEKLFEKLSLKDKKKQQLLERSILNAASNYFSFYEDYLNHVPDHKAREEIKYISKEMKNIKKRLPKIFKDRLRLSQVGRAFLKECKQKHPELKGLVTDIEVKENEFFTVHRTLVFLTVFDCLHAAFDQTGKSYKKKLFKPTKSEAIEHWLTSFSSVLESILERPLQQRRYEPKRGFIDKKDKIYDSDILLFILKPICPNATLTQIERAIKETKDERLNPPWEDL